MKNILIAFIVLVAAGAAYFFFMQKSPVPQIPSTVMSSTSPTSAAPVTETIPTGMKLYSNPRYHFSLIYPDTLSVREQGGGGNALTVAFEDAQTGGGFQIFSTPYNETSISATRFKQDEPSGVMSQPVDVVINGVTARHFFGKNDVMGDTAEVWFIKDGILYEVSTYKELDQSLSEIMQTWKFI